MVHERKTDLSAAVADPIDVVINGERRRISSGLSIDVLLASLAVDPERVAVELNREIVHRAMWTSTIVEDSAVMEIVQFVGGG